MPPKPRDEEESESESDEEEEGEETEEDEGEESEEDDETPVKATANTRLNMSSSVAAAPRGDDAEFDFNNTMGNSRSQKISNQHVDEVFNVEDDSGAVTPPRNRAERSVEKSDTRLQALKNTDFDAALDIGDGEDLSSNEPTPKGHQRAPPAKALPSSSTKPAKLTNQKHDEAIDIDGDEDMSSEDERPVIPQQQQLVPKPAQNQKMAPIQQQLKSTPISKPKQQHRDDDDEDEESSEEDEAPPIPNPQSQLDYDPSRFANLKVSKEIKDLFALITVYKPQLMELETKIKPFIPDFIPSVGDIDTFIKIPRPDNKTDNLGLTVLDEPSSKQSIESIVKLGLQYFATNQKAARASIQVDTIEDAQKYPSKINNWVEKVSEIHKKKPSINVNYTKPMPDVDSLLQVWPENFEELLNRMDTFLPSGDIDLELHEFVRVICALLDIPVYDNIIESLHMLFTVYAEFKSNQHFGASHIEL